MFEQEIQRGIAFLDERYPKWEEKVNVKTLDMLRSNACVVGQVAGDFWDVFGYADQAIALGFMLPRTLMCVPEYVALYQQEWREAIRKRQQHTRFPEFVSPRKGEKVQAIATHDLHGRRRIAYVYDEDGFVFGGEL